MVASLEQTRQLVTEIPGPASLELTKRRAAAVSHAVNVSVPVFVARAGGGIVEDVDGNRLIDLGSGIAVTTIGNSSPRVVEAVRARDALLGRGVRWAGGRGTGAGVDSGGRLVVATETGAVALDAGEVHLLP